MEGMSGVGVVLTENNKREYGTSEPFRCLIKILLKKEC